MFASYAAVCGNVADAGRRIVIEILPGILFLEIPSFSQHYEEVMNNIEKEYMIHEQGMIVEEIRKKIDDLLNSQSDSYATSDNQPLETDPGGPESL